MSEFFDVSAVCSYLHRAIWARYFCRDNFPLWKHLSDILGFERENESGSARHE